MKFIFSRKIKARDPVTGEFEGINAFAAESTEEYLDKIQKKGEDTLSAVGAEMDAHGQRVLKSLPEEYTNLVVQSMGNSKTQVMSQNAATRELSNISTSQVAFVESNNLLLKQEFTDNAYVNYVDGTLYLTSDVSMNYFCTGYVPIEEGITYKGNFVRNGAWYDESKIYISGFQDLQNELVAPSGACYVRYSISKADTTMTKAYLYDADLYDHLFVKIPLLDFLTSWGDGYLLEPHVNIANVQKDNNLIQTYRGFENNCYVKPESGILNANDDYFSTTYIPVNEGATYKGNCVRNGAWFDEGKNYISGFQGWQNEIVAPSGACYVRFSVKKTEAGLPTDVFFSTLEKYPTEPEEPTKYWCTGKTINWIGDSIVDGEDFDEIVASTLGMTLHEYGVNGATIAYNGTAERHCISASYADMSDDCDIIAVSCGTNDFQYNWTDIGTIDDTNNTTFYGALKVLCEGLLAKYPEKTIFFTTPIKRAQSPYVTPTSQNEKGKTLRDYCNIIKEVCALYSIPVLDMWSESGLNPYLQSQTYLFDDVNTHPTAQGKKIMARRVCGFITQLSADIN